MTIVEHLLISVGSSCGQMRDVSKISRAKTLATEEKESEGGAMEQNEQTVKNVRKQVYKAKW